MALTNYPVKRTMTDYEVCKRNRELADAAEKELDPMSCLPKRNTKYAGENEEVHMSGLDGTSLSPNFQYFTNLSVLWLNDNKLTHIENMDACFRLRELYVENNRLVSLSFLKCFKFMRTLLVSNNQIRNLDKQLELLTRASFIRKLDLFDNPIADEPDYRLRMIYHVPQVELLDRLGVTLPQRQRADEVVPNMDKVAASQPVREKKKPFTFSETERDCFRTAKSIKNQRVQAAEMALTSKLFTTHLHMSTPFPRCKAALANNDKWACPLNIIEHEQSKPSPYEKDDMRPCIKELAGKDELTKEDVVELARQLHEEGIEQVGRVLRNCDVFAPLPKSPGESNTEWMTPKKKDKQAIVNRHPLEPLVNDPEATMPIKDIIAYLVSLDWSRWDDKTLDERIAQHHKAALEAQSSGDEATLVQSRNAMMRLEGVKTRKQEVSLVAKPNAGVLRKTRSDVFDQSFLHATKGVDETTGKTKIFVAKLGSTTKICG